MSVSSPKCLSVGFSLLAFSAGIFAQDIGPSGPAAAATTSAAPKTPATKTITSFSQALRCMDELFLAHGKQGIVITSAGIPDETQKVKTGTKEMMITALAKMTLKSNAFEFIDFHGGGDDLARLFEARGDAGRKIPDYYIRGSITQMDDNSVRSSKGMGLSLPFLDLGYSKDEAFDLLSMDMSIGEAATRKILPVTSTSNTMVMIKGGKSGEAGGKLGKIGLSFNLDLSRSEGLGATTRALLELSLIETMGKFTQVPYWRCLDTDITNPLIRDQARESYDMLQDKERVVFIQRKLGGSMNRYKGPVDGLVNADLKQAVGEYQAAVGLVANGQINFDLYASLLDDVQNSLAALPAVQSRLPPPGVYAAIGAPPPPAPGSAPASTPASNGKAFSVTLNSDKGPRPAYSIGEFLNMNLSLTSDGTAYCYYEDIAHNTARIFPNQFQPNPTLRGNNSVRLPSAGFKIRFDQAGREKVACIAADRELIVPKSLVGVKDLTPLPTKSVDDVVNQFRQINPSAMVSQIDITVNR
jgi:peptidoglycan hydrolase-like protein with peptidoglycan-binding domain